MVGPGQSWKQTERERERERERENLSLFQVFPKLMLTYGKNMGITNQ
jgi:hypothetical protein